MILSAMILAGEVCPVLYFTNEVAQFGNDCEGCAIRGFGIIDWYIFDTADCTHGHKMYIVYGILGEMRHKRRALH